MTHTTIKRSVVIEAIDGLKEHIRDWKAYQAENNLHERAGINEILSDCEAVIAALEGDTITIDP